MLGTLYLLTSCALYQPAPIDLARDSETWRQVSAAACPPGQRLTRERMHRIGLWLNPGLNEARLVHARSTAVANYAGLWEDPSISGDMKRVLRESVTNREFGLSLALPLTGIPSLSKKAAEQYREADFWTVMEKERAYLEELDALRTTILLTHAKHGLMQKRLAVLRDERDRISRLYELGETGFSEYQLTNQRLNDTIKEEQELANLHLEKHLELANLLGLHPDFRKQELDETLPKGIPATVRAPSAAELLENPALHAQLAAYGGTEKELQAEIRRQYPQLSLGGGYTYEGREDQLGLGFELSLPLWNRNREAIARAAGDRALKQAETLSTWKNLLQQAATLSDRQQLALKHCHTEKERLDALVDNAEKQEKLYVLGEASLPELAETRHEVYQRRLNYLDCLGELMGIQVKLQYLSHAQ